MKTFWKIIFYITFVGMWLTIGLGLSTIIIKGADTPTWVIYTTICSLCAAGVLLPISGSNMED